MDPAIHQLSEATGRWRPFETDLSRLRVDVDSEIRVMVDLGKHLRFIHEVPMASKPRVGLLAGRPSLRLDEVPSG